MDEITDNDVPCFFQASDETLFGILTEPSVAPTGTAAVVLRGGGHGPSSGRNQTLAHLCRRLAGDGFHGFRFDYRGVGESTGSVESFRLDEPFTEDLEAAVRWLRICGLERFALLGTCFGARTALASAPTLPGLEAIVLISPPVRDQEKDEVGTRPLVPDRTVWQYARRAVRPHVVRGLLRRDQRRSYARWIKSAWRSRHRPSNAVGASAIEPPWVSRQFITSLETVQRRGIPTLMVCGTGDPGYGDFSKALSGRLGQLVHDPGSVVTVEVLDGRVGAFADATLQEPVLDLVASWLVAQRESFSVSGARAELELDPPGARGSG